MEQLGIPAPNGIERGTTAPNIQSQLVHSEPPSGTVLFHSLRWQAMHQGALKLGLQMSSRSLNSEEAQARHQEAVARSWPHAKLLRPLPELTRWQLQLQQWNQRLALHTTLLAEQTFGFRPKRPNEESHQLPGRLNRSAQRLRW